METTCDNLSFLRKQEFTKPSRSWISAFAGMAAGIGQFEFISVILKDQFWRQSKDRINFMPDVYYFTLIIFVLVLVVLAVLRHKIYYHFKVVEHGKLYRSGKLSVVGLHLVCRNYNIKTIISLIPPKQSVGHDYYKMEERFCRQHNIKLINIPLIVDNPPEPEKVRQFLRISMNPDFQPVLVHCEAGIIRTNMIIATYLKNRFDQSNQMIFENLPFFGHSLDKRPAVKDFIISYQKESWDVDSEQAGKVKTQVKIESYNIDNPMIPKGDFELPSLIMPGKNDA